MIQILVADRKEYEDLCGMKKHFLITIKNQDFKIGEKVLVCEFLFNKYTGRIHTRTINYIYNGTNEEDGLRKDFCIIGFKENSKGE